MTLNITKIALAATFILVGQTAFAQDSSNQQTMAQSSAAQNVTTATTSKHRVKVVKLPTSNLKNATNLVSKGRVIHNANLGRTEMKLFRPTTKKSSTPNLYRN